MSQMKDSQLDPRWLAEQMRVNPPKVLPNGNIFSGPVRLSFANIFQPGKPNVAGGEGKFGAALLFPLGANMTVFQQAWLKAAHEAFPRNWDAQGQPIGLHIPFHDQKEKAFGAQPLAGYTPGAIALNVGSKFKPPVVDVNMNPITDESRVYSGVWVFVALNTYKYGPPQPKSGIGFGLQTVMVIADDMKLSGGGGNPATDFAGITITAASNVADKFNDAPVAQQNAGAGVMPGGGFMGQPGNLPIQPLVSVEDLM